MKSSLSSSSLSPFLLLLAVLLFNSSASYASVVKSRAIVTEESSSSGLEERGWSKLAPGAICTANKQCLFGSCFNGACLGLANRPVNAPCLLTLQCNSQDFCSRGKCAVKLAGGQSCTSGSQCQSNVCQRQLRQLVCKAIATPTSPSSPTGTAALSSAASAAIASATTVSSTPFTGTGGPLLSLGAGTIKAIGAVSVVAGKIQLAATSAQPAYFQDTFAQAVTKRGSFQRRQAASTFFSFNYAVSNFVANPTTSICQLIPSVNGVNLSPPINITSGTTSGTGNFVVNSGSITSFGTAVVCMAGASGTVTPSDYAFQAVNLPPSSTTTTSIIPSSISIPPVGSTSTISTSTKASSSSPSPTPSASCSGWPSCGFENGSFLEDNKGFDSDSNAGGNCNITTTYAHTGIYSAMCTLPSMPTSSSETFLDSVEDGYVAGQNYTMTWYNKLGDNTYVGYIGARAFDTQSNQAPGTLSLLNPDSNGWSKYTFVFTATYNIMEVTIDMTTPGTFYFDDFSMSPSIFPLPSTTPSTSTITPTSTPTAGPSAPTSSSPTSSPTSSSPSPTPTPSPTCSGWPDCSFEDDAPQDDIANPAIWGSASNAEGFCAINSTVVHSGKQSAKCSLPTILSAYSETWLQNLMPGYTVGQNYVMTYFANFLDGAEVEALTQQAFDSKGHTISGTQLSQVGNPDANGWQQFRFAFTANDTTMEVKINMFKVGNYFFDDFSMTPSVYPNTATTSSIPTSTISPTANPYQSVTRTNLINPDFNYGTTGYTFTGNATSITTANNASLAMDGPYLQVVLPVGGYWNLTQQVAQSPQRKRIVGEYRFFVNYRPIAFDNSAASTAITYPDGVADCSILYGINGVYYDGGSIFHGVSQGWISDSDESADAQLSSIDMQISCLPGVSTTVLIDKLSYEYVGYVDGGTTIYPSPTASVAATQ